MTSPPLDRSAAGSDANTFRGRVTLLGTNPRVMRLFWASIPVLVALAVLIRFVPFAQEHAQVILVGFGLVYAALLSFYLRPKRQELTLEVDGRGVFAGGQCLVERKRIAEAYLREASAASEVNGVVIPARPLTVELITDREPVCLDAGSEESSARILTALGFPVTRVPAKHVPAKPRRK